MSARHDGHDGAPAVLGIDVGSTNTKLSLVAAGDVRELRILRIPTPSAARDLLEVVGRGLETLLADAPPPSAIGIASMAETGVPIGADGAPLGDLVRWNRGDAAPPPVDPGARAAHFAATGVFLGPKTPLTMWRELAQHDPGRWQAMHRWAGAADLVALALTGRLATDHTLAGRSGAYRLPPAGAPLPDGFDAELLAPAGLDPSRLPDVVPPGDAVGEVATDWAHAHGLAAGIPVVIAGHDHAVAAWGAGVRGPGAAADSIGTTEALVRVAAGAVDRDGAFARGMSVLRAVDGVHESVIAGATGAGALVAEWAGLVPRADGASIGDDLAASTDLMVLPYPAGRQSPRPDPDATLRILGPDGRPVDPGTRTAGELDLALLIAMCRQLRWMDDEQRALLGADPEPLRVLGGIAGENRRWLELKEELLPAPLEVVERSEPVATAAALRAAVVAGLVPAASRLPVRALGASAAPSDPGTAPASSADSGYDAFVAAATTPSRPEGATR